MPSVEEAIAAAQAARARAEAARKPTRDAKEKFRSSLKWRRVRYTVLAESAAKNGGKPVCAICGAGAEPGKPLHVDHVRPVSSPEGWARRFDRALLRVCCADCNVGRLAMPIEAEGWAPGEPG